MIKVNEFIKKLKEVEKLPSLYGYGKFGNSKHLGYWLWDCSGLIKGILWGYPFNGKYKSNYVPDVNANTIISKYCTNVSTNFNKIEIGEFVWLNNHCGIYIGNGEVIESTPIWENGVQVTKLNKRNWVKHGKLVWIDYKKEVDSYNNLITTIAKKVVNGDFGNGHAKREKEISKLYPTVKYQDVRNRVNAYYKNGGKW